MENRKEYMKKYMIENKESANASKRRWQRNKTDRENIFKLKEMIKQMGAIVKNYRVETDIGDGEDRRYKN